MREMIRDLNPLDYEEIEEKISQLPIPVNEYGYDHFGLNLSNIKPMMKVALWFYRYYFRVQTYGIENLPKGRVLLAANHSGQVPIDGAMINMATFMEAKPPRICRSMVDKFVSELPFVSTIFTRAGQITGLPKNCKYLLDNESAVLVFPEGTRGINKPWTRNYQLVDFGTGFVRLALESNAPIVPVAVVGAEEQYPTLFNARLLAKLLDIPAFPVTVFFPWLGPLGAIPLPTKYHIYFGEPMKFECSTNDDDDVIMEKVEQVRSTIQQMINEGLRKRKGIFK